MFKSIANTLNRLHPKLAQTWHLSTAFTGMVVNTFVHGPIIWVTGIPAVVMPHNWQLTKALDKLNIGIANSWIRTNNILIDKLLPNIEWTINTPTGNDALSTDSKYILICNHQTWVDTTVIQYIGLNQLPFTRFFTKFELIYIPFVGQAFKFLGFPMMKRHSKQAIAKNPHLKGQDLAAAKQACAKMQTTPFTLLNFIEGTRINSAKHQEQQSPYQHLLKPKYAGMFLALDILGKNVNALLDMTIIYPDGVPAYMDLWKGNIKRIVVHINTIDIPSWIHGGDYHHNDEYKAQFKQWVDNHWQQKDALISTLLKEHAPAISALEST